MKEDQIKAIAEAYAHIVMDMHKSDPDITGFEWQAEFDACMEAAEDIVGAISTRYCIVEREKVMKEIRTVGWYDQQKEVLNRIFGTSMFNQNEAQYTAQCETCMRKLAGEVLDVCKDSSSEHRHCAPWGREKQDYCLYKMYWELYPESYWQTILTPEQFALAKSLNQNKE